MPDERLESKSGPWIGWWIQGPEKGHQRMTLRFGAGEISGEGSDKSGGFGVTGEYDGNDVVMVKNYMFWQVRYTGKWDGQMISGRWTILDGNFFDAGAYEIWPETDVDAEDELLILGAMDVLDLLPSGS